ncbi:MAG: peptide chain release factor 2 [Candidatus Omnitrophica bacterium]|nr:peptide chain release factor 2 [Candidatus Omnitrophota bacterium]
MFEEIKKIAKDIGTRLDLLRSFIDLPQKEKRIEAIQGEMNQPNFWNDSVLSNKLVKELKYLKSCVVPFHKSAEKLQELNELVEISQDEEEMLQQIYDEIQVLTKDVSEVELKNILAGPYDRSNAILSINAGAGGTESCDWANMLLRMYMRWVDRKKASVKIIDTLPGEEAGIKSVTLSIEGEMIYGYLKSEKGVHRLVRISPFDSNKRRHTSFASVDVIPAVEDDATIEISPDDLRVDIFRSSGPGGQSVNTTDSAVRLTHIPTNIVVQCQNERSQLQNKQMAMRILKARLLERKRQEQSERMAKEYGRKQKIEWGSQIRSYVMHPYNMVKDHRTSVETGNVPRVMDGDIDQFIEAYLRWKPEE